MEKKTYYDELAICFIVIIRIGLFQAYEFQQKSVEPLDLAIKHLNRIAVSSDPQTIRSDIELTKGNIPWRGNPVFIYPTYSTDFAKIQTNLDIMMTGVLKISDIPIDSSGFHNGLEQLHFTAKVISENIADAKSSLYASPPNIIFTAIWLIGTLSLIETLIRKTNSLY